MADHVRLLNDLSLAARGISIKSQPTLGFGGSYNYGKMRIAAAYVHALLTGDRALALAARTMWLENEEEQRRDGHWTHREQCEQLTPQPHSEFLVAPCCLMWREALREGDTELAAACEAEMGRSIAVWRRLSLGGIVCCPAARAKDPEDKSNDAGVGQWRNRPGDAILSRVVTGKRGVKFNGLSVQLFDECLELAGVKYAAGRASVALSLRLAPLPKLRAPIHYLSLPGGGYAAWHEPIPTNRRALGRDVLSGVVHQQPGKPELYYDWRSMPEEIVRGSAGKVEIIGA